MRSPLNPSFRVVTSLVAQCFALLFITSATAGTIAFPDTPLSAQNAPPPNVIFDMSVEWPTMGPAYYGAESYVATTTYIGYWDPLKCYKYSISRTTAVNDGYFYPVGAVSNLTTKACGTGGDKWSGNLLNWANTSAIDTFRKNMTGGTRIVDTTSQTVLQRSVLKPPVTGTYPVRRIAASVNVAPNTVAEIGSNTSAIRIWQEDGASFLFAEFNASDVQITGFDRWRFNAHVEVCKNNVGGAGAASLEANCSLFGATYKPTGNMQKYASSMRFAAFGYLIDGTNQRSGGVLKAPIKSVGPKQWDSTQGSVPNPAKEWDPSTGIFLTDPENAKAADSDVVSSGVINYLNKFGSVSGYKGYDPVGEMYSESVRYLMKKQPVPSYVAGIQSYMKDGSPVYTRWTDPVIAACQKQNIIVVGDNNTWCDGSVPGGAEFDTGQCTQATDVPNDFDATAWTRKIESQEGRNLVGVRSGGPDGSSYLWAGISYFAHTSNLRPEFSTAVQATTYTIDVNEGSATPYGRRSYAYAAKYGGFVDKAGSGVVGKPDAGEWEANPSDPNSLPKNYFVANDPERMNSGLDIIFATIQSQTAAVGKASTTSSRVGTSTGVFAVTTDADNWTGDIQKYAISVGTTNGATTLNVSTNPSWALSAAQWLDGLPSVSGSLPTPPSLLPAARNIVTVLPGTDTPADVSDTNAALLAFFNVDPASPVASPKNDNLGSQRIQWLRGARDNESPNGEKLRARRSLLGDVGRSNVVYVGPPVATGADPTFLTFLRANASRSAIFAGTSDGMLHGFDAGTGKELFAYVPSPLLSQVRASTVVSFVRKPMVDAPPVVADVQIGGQWRTYVVGGFGAGARGLYAVDATDPTAMSASSIKWEFRPDNIAAADAADLGQITGEPKVARLPDGTWALLVGNGYNSPNSGSALFVIKLDKGSGGWVNGTNYWKIAGAIPATPATAPANGMGPVGLASGNNSGTVDFAYAGDLLGNLFRFKFELGKSIVTVPSGAPMFVAKENNASTGALLPITTAPKAAFGYGGGYVVLFGTGQLLSTADQTAPFNTQAVFSLYDQTKTGAIAATALVSRTLRTVNNTTKTIDGAAIAATKQGWYLPLAVAGGERVVADPTLDFGKFAFATVAMGAATCGTGDSWLYDLDPISGLPPALSFDTNGDGKVDSNDTQNIGGIKLDATTLASPGTLRINIDPPVSTAAGAVAAPPLYFSLLPSSVPGKPVVGLLNKASGVYGRLNFRQLNR